MEIHLCPVADILDDARFEELINEYAEESKAQEAPEPKPDRELYELLEKKGALHSLRALHNGEMIGFATVIVNQVPHYGDPIATTESLFVEKAMRSTGAGLALIKAAEQVARYKKCGSLFVSAPTGSSLEKLMTRMKYRHSHSTFVRAL
jgi:GNAT superfamily N-acetyltransferase